MPIKEGSTGILLNSWDCQFPGKLSPKGYIISISLGSMGGTKNAQFKNRSQTKILHAKWRVPKVKSFCYNKLPGALTGDFSWGCRLLEASPSTVSLVVVAGGRACANICTDYCE